jgi:hypothetical protein
MKKERKLNISEQKLEAYITAFAIFCLLCSNSGFCSGDCSFRIIRNVERIIMAMKENIHYKINNKTGCHEWLRATLGRGYGQLWYKGEKYLAHRLSYKINKGDIGDYHVLHTCDNPKCINPDHLWLGTNTDNMNDKIKKGRVVKGENHPQAKLTDRQIKTLKSLYSTGEFFQKDLGIIFGIVQSQVSALINNKKRQ